MIYVYALTDPLESLDGLPPGFDDATVAQVAAGPVAAAYSPGSRPETSADNLWRHEAVVEALMERGATLPTRFGTVVDGPGWLEHVLGEHAGAISAALDEVRGLVEVGVRVRSKEPRPDEPAEEQRTASGRDYLLRRFELEQRRRAQRQELGGSAQAVLAPLRELARAVRWHEPRDDHALVSAAYLVAPAAVESFAAEVARLDGQRGDVELLATGPWPPYSFVPTLDLSWIRGA